MGSAIISRRDYSGKSTENNGKVWTRSTSALSGGNINFATYGNGRWVSANYDGIFYSDNNGKTWVASNVTESCDSAIYENGQWIAFPNYYAYLYYSTDGKIWTQIVLSSEKSRIDFVTYTNGLWLAGGYYGLYYSTDGLNWMQSNLTDDVGFAINANNLWVTGGYDGTYYS